MPVIAFDAGTAPKVERYNDGVLAWGIDGAEEHGIFLSPTQAVDVAIKLLREVEAIKGDDLPGIDAKAVAFDSYRGSKPEDAGVRLVFDIGAPVAVFLNLDQFGDLMANGAAVSKLLDAEFLPRKDDGAE